MGKEAHDTAYFERPETMVNKENFKDFIKMKY